MPIHDWTRVDAGLFHDFHQDWTIELRRSLNAGRLPGGYVALTDQQISGPIPDVLTLHRTPSRAERPETSALAVATAPPKARIIDTIEDETYARRANRIRIQHRHGRVVAIIEIVSPGNKNSRNALRAFVRKASDLIWQGIHLLVIDLGRSVIIDNYLGRIQLRRPGETRHPGREPDSYTILKSVLAEVGMEKLQRHLDTQAKKAVKQVTKRMLANKTSGDMVAEAVAENERVFKEVVRNPKARETDTYRSILEEGQAMATREDILGFRRRTVGYARRIDQKSAQRHRGPGPPQTHGAARCQSGWLARDSRYSVIATGKRF